MGVRPGRVLPSVIVGGLLATGVALGTGTATAADTCTIGGVEYDMSGATSAAGQGAGGQCTKKVTQEVVTQKQSGVDALGQPILENVTETTTSDVAAGADDVGDLGLTKYVPPKAETPSTGSGDSGSTPSTGAPSSGGLVTLKPRPAPAPAAAPVAGPAPAAAPVPAPVPAAAPAPAAVPPAITNYSAPLSGPGLGGGLSGFTAGAPLAGSLPGYDPGLLLAPGFGNPTTALAANPATSVTTASQVQAMALDGLPHGAGVPALAGTGILASFAALLLRQRMLARLRRRLAATDPGGPATPPSA